jgi:hypothetical protein
VAAKHWLAYSSGENRPNVIIVNYDSDEIIASFPCIEMPSPSFPC